MEHDSELAYWLVAAVAQLRTQLSAAIQDATWLIGNSVVGVELEVDGNEVVEMTELRKSIWMVTSTRKEKQC